MCIPWPSSPILKTKPKRNIVLNKNKSYSIYPSSHNHGSVKNGCISNTSFLSFRVVFHWTMIVGGFGYRSTPNHVGLVSSQVSPPWPPCRHRPALSRTCVEAKQTLKAHRKLGRSLLSYGKWVGKDHISQPIKEEEHHRDPGGNIFCEKTGTQARQSHRSCCRWKSVWYLWSKSFMTPCRHTKKLALNSFLGAQATSSWTDLGGDSHEIWKHVISHLNHIQNSTHGICWQLISRDFILPILYLNQGSSPSFFRKQQDCYLVSIKQQCYCSRAIMVHDGYRKFHSSKFQNAVNIAPIIPYWRTNNNNSFDKVITSLWLSTVFFIKTQDPLIMTLPKSCIHICLEWSSYHCTQQWRFVLQSEIPTSAASLDLAFLFQNSTIFQ